MRVLLSLPPSLQLEKSTHAHTHSRVTDDERSGRDIHDWPRKKKKGKKSHPVKPKINKHNAISAEQEQGPDSPELTGVEMSCNMTGV